MEPKKMDSDSSHPSGGDKCAHRYLTAFPGSGGWVCADCKVPMLSLSMPIPLPLIATALAIVSRRAQGATA